MAGEKASGGSVKASSHTQGGRKKRSREDGDVSAQQGDGTLQQHVKRAQLGDGAHQAGPDAIRKQIRRIYDIQSSLACSSTATDPSSLLPAYEGLLQAATGEYCATRRLAARLIPRFLHLFPHRVDAAAMALMAVYAPKQPARDDLPAIVEAAQADALHGLSRVLDIAYKLVDKAVATVLRLADFEMRLIHAHVQGSEPPVDTQQQQQPTQRVPPPVSLRRPNPEVLQQLIRRTFELFPRVVISLCLQAFRGTDPVLQVAAGWVLKHQLLRPEPPPAAAAPKHEAAAPEQQANGTTGPAAAGTPPADHHDSSVAGTHIKEEGNGNGTLAEGEHAGAAATAAAAAADGGPAAPADVAPPHCLARTVLCALPDTQQWLRTAITAVTKDKRALPPEAAVLVQQLMSLAAPPPPPPPGPASAQGQATAGTGADTARAGGEQSAVAGTRAAAAHFVLPPPPQLLHGAQQEARPSADGQQDGNAPGSDNMVVSPPPGPGLGQGGVASAGGLLTPLPVRGGPVTRADCCLYLMQLPPSLTAPSLHAECDRHGLVDSVHLGPPALALGEALVVFKSVNDAALCYQAIAEMPAWGGTRPVRCDFCPGLPADCPMRAREGPGRPASHYVWCAAVAPPEHIYTHIQQAGLPLPRTVLRVSGRAPGCLLDMPDAQCVQQIVEFVLSRFLPGTPPPPFLLPASLQPQPSLASAASLQSQHSLVSAGGGLLPTSSSTAALGLGGLGPAQNRAPLQRAPSLHAGPGGGAAGLSGPGALQGGARGGAGGGGGLGPGPVHTPQAGGALTAPHPGLRTLWVGQVHDSISEELLLGTFRRFGELVGWRVLRSSHCAFLDFATHAAAAEAQRAMHGSKLAGHVLRVEWKMDPKLQGSQAQATPQPLPQQSAMLHTPAGGGSFTGRPAVPGLPFTPAHTPSPYPPQAGSAAQQGLLSGMSTPAGASSTPRLHPGGPAYAAQATPVLLGRRPSLTPQHQHLQEPGPGPQQPPQGLQQPLPASLPGPPGTGGWQGLLAKSGAPVCTVVCMPPEPSSARGAHEPLGWPGSLDVRMRVDLQYVVGVVWSSTPAHLRAARRLLAAAPEADTQRLVEFVRYLADKGRAGVIKLEGGPHGPRTLYLVPPSPHTAQALGLSWEPRRDAAALLAVVVPTPSTASAR